MVDIVDLLQDLGNTREERRGVVVVQDIQIDTVRTRSAQRLAVLTAVDQVADHVEDHGARANRLEIAARHLEDERHSARHGRHNRAATLDTPPELERLHVARKRGKRQEARLVRPRRPDHQPVGHDKRRRILCECTVGQDQPPVARQAKGRGVRRGKDDQSLAKGRQRRQWRRGRDIDDAAVGAVHDQRLGLAHGH